MKQFLFQRELIHRFEIVGENGQEYIMIARI